MRKTKFLDFVIESVFFSHRRDRNIESAIKSMKSTGIRGVYASVIAISHNGSRNSTVPGPNKQKARWEAKM